MTKELHIPTLLDDSDVADATDSGAVSRYEFENDVTDSWGTNDGTDNTTVTYRNGVRGESKDFDAGGLVNVPNNGSFNFGTGSFTSSIWLKVDSFPTANPRMYYSSGDTSSDGRISLFVDDGSSNVRTEVYDVNSATSTLTGGTTISTGEWVHAVQVWNGATDTQKLYVNGLLDAEDTTTLDSIDTNDSWDFGGNSSGGDFDGSLDDARIYDRALSSNEVSALYQWGRGQDFSGNGNDGQINGANSVTGPFGNSAFDFDGADDWVDLGEIPYSGPQTISAWVNRGISSGEFLSRSNARFTLAYESFGTNGYELRSFDGSSEVLTTTGVTISSEWVHLVATFDGSTQRIYVNGVEEGSTATSNIQDATNADAIGANEGGGNAIDGQVADARIYDRALSPQEVQYLYQAGERSEAVFGVTDSTTAAQSVSGGGGGSTGGGGGGTTY